MIAHEFVEAWVLAGRKLPRLAPLPLRRHLADPFDVAARPALPSINTLTIPRCGARSNGSTPRSFSAIPNTTAIR